jgi:hypothetical protein
MEAQALEVVDEIVPRGHLGKEVLHPLGPLFALHVEFSRHAVGQ